MQIFQSTNNQNTFKFNGLTYPKNFMCIKQGAENIAIHNAYDTKLQLLGSTNYSDIEVNGVVYGSQAELMAALSLLLFAKQFNYIVQDINATKLTSIGAITVDTNYVTVEPATWVINGVDFESTTDTILTVPYAASGKTRIDLIVANSSSQIVRIAGSETTGLAIAPITPIDAVYISQITVNDNSIDTPTTPITGSLYVKKEEFAENYIETSGTVSLDLLDDKTAFRFINGNVNIIRGFNANSYFLDSVYYVGKEIKIANSQSNSISLKHNDGAIDIPMYFPNGNDFVLEQNEVAIFKLTKTTGTFAEFISVNRITTGTTGNIITVTGGTYSNGTASFTNSTGGTFSVSGFTNPYTGGTITGGTYSNGIATFTNSNGNNFNVTGFTNPFTGGTVTGGTNFTDGLTATTISATTYENLPSISLDELYDVTVSAPFNGQAVVYNNGTWTNTTILTSNNGGSIQARQNHVNMPVFASPNLNNVEGVPLVATVTQRSFTGTNNYSRTQRAGIATPTTGNIAQMRQTQVYFNRNSGYDVWFKFGMAENASDPDVRMFIGLSANIIFSAVEPTTLTNCIGLGKISGSTNLHIIHNDSSGLPTTIDLGSNFPINTVETDVYICNITVSGTNIVVTVSKVDSVISSTVTLSTNLPTATQGLNFGGYIYDTAGPSVLTAFDFMGMTVRA